MNQIGEVNEYHRVSGMYRTSLKYMIRGCDKTNYSVLGTIIFYSLCIIYIQKVMDFDEVIKKRKMIREYQHDRQIPTDIINKLLRNAHRSPSAGHTQVQEFIVVIDPITKRKLCQASLGQSQVEDASVLIIVCSNTSRSVDRYRKRGIEFYSIIDGAFASMIILLSAVNEGIGASFVGAFEDNEVRKILR